MPNPSSVLPYSGGWPSGTGVGVAGSGSVVGVEEEDL